MKKISIAGTIAVDYLKTVASYPEKGMLADIINIRRSIGGCVPNVAMDLRQIDSTLQIAALGKVGNDESAAYVRSVLAAANINTMGILTSDCGKTSFTDVIAESNGDRTFFHLRGANSTFSETDINLDELNCDHFHIGYLLLLDMLDQNDPVYGTRMASLLRAIKAKGITTSIDVVSENRNRYQEIIIPSLKYSDYVIINEIEAGRITNTAVRDDNGNISVPNIIEAVTKLMRLGVRQKAFIHCPELGVCLSDDGTVSVVPSIMIDPALIKGTVGAGDAFCAGVLYGLAKEMVDEDILKFASAAASLCLQSEESTGGLDIYERILAYEKQAIRRTI